MQQLIGIVCMVWYLGVMGLSINPLIIYEDTEYTWDANGNMTSDLNKGITGIEYNILNLPRRATFADGHITEYLYDAGGDKLQTKCLIDNRMVFAASMLGETEYVMAFSGTDFNSMTDWENNISQLIGQSEQYAIAIDIAKNFKIPGTLTFVGYSLGGGLAAASAYATNGRAITFNAAGVSPFTVNVHSVAKIDAYINYRDELNYYQTILPFVPTANGTKHFRFGNNSLLGHDIKNFYK